MAKWRSTVAAGAALASSGCWVLAGTGDFIDGASDGGGGASSGGAGGLADGGATNAGGSGGDTGSASGGGGGLLEKIVFVSTDKVTPGVHFESPEELDAQCAGEKNGAYVAWLSVGSSPAIDRIAKAKYVLSIGGPVVFPDVAHIKAGLPPLVSLNLDGDGNVVPDGDGVWTGTTPDGQATASYNCGDFKDSTVGMTGTYGTVGATDGTWTDTGELSCLSTLRFYCFEK